MIFKLKKSIKCSSTLCSQVGSIIDYFTDINKAYREAEIYNNNIGMPVACPCQVEVVEVEE